MLKEEEKWQKKVGINKEKLEEIRREGQKHHELYYFLRVWEHPQAWISSWHKSVAVHWYQLISVSTDNSGFPSQTLSTSLTSSTTLQEVALRDWERACGSREQWWKLGWGLMDLRPLASAAPWGAVKSLNLCICPTFSTNGVQLNVMAPGTVTVSLCTFHFTHTTTILQNSYLFPSKLSVSLMLLPWA